MCGYGSLRQVKNKWLKIRGEKNGIGKKNYSLYTCVLYAGIVLRCYYYFCNPAEIVVVFQGPIVPPEIYRGVGSGEVGY